MDDIDLLREQLPEAPAPSENAKRRASARLARAMRDEAWRATTREGDQGLVGGLARMIRRRPRRSALALALVAAAAAALFISPPRRDSPGFLARAEAALSAGTVLHMKMQTTSTWTRPACTVTYSEAEVWIDETSPNTYRVFLNDLPPDPDNADPRTRRCFSARPFELGGSYDTTETLRFIPPNRLKLSDYERRFRFPLDVATDFRAAISAGRAHDEGKTVLDGRRVERIRIDPPSNCPRQVTNCPRDPLYAYVDPETFYPILFVSTTSQIEVVGSPSRSSYSQIRVRDVTHYLTFEYLPRTASNLALTDIRAQHPDATIR